MYCVVVMAQWLLEGERLPRGMCRETERAVDDVLATLPAEIQEKIRGRVFVGGWGVAL